MMTEYQISGSTPVTSRENGALHDTVIDEVLLAVSRFTTDDSSPVKNIYTPWLEVMGQMFTLECGKLDIYALPCKPGPIPQLKAHEGRGGV